MTGIHVSIFAFALLFQLCYVYGKPQCRHGVLQMANPDDCHSYYMCDSMGRAVLVRCAGNKRYNPRTGYCVGSQRSGGDCWPDGKETKANPESCSSYFRCVEGRVLLARCPHGKLYSPLEERCETPSRSTCRPSSSARVLRLDCSQESHRGWPRTYQNPDDCTTYYTCNQGKPVLTPCPRGLNFNPERGGCDDTRPHGCKPRHPRPINYQVHE